MCMCITADKRLSAASIRGVTNQVPLKKPELRMKISDSEARHQSDRLNKYRALGEPRQGRRCGAKTRSGRPCRTPAMTNGRCRMHGGTSTGPRTAEGLQRSKHARWKHGFYSAAAKAERRAFRDALKTWYLPNGLR